MACRWIWEECRRRRWEYRLVTPDNYIDARKHDAVEGLFSVERRGIVFFDDMDLALRDRETVQETDNQAVFLSAMDGISVNEGVVLIFHHELRPNLIDRAFKRPGRLDVMLHFQPPRRHLRRRLDGELASGNPGEPRPERGRGDDGRPKFRGNRRVEESPGAALHGKRGVELGMGLETVFRQPSD